MINLVKINNFIILFFLAIFSFPSYAADNTDQIISNLIQSTQSLPLQQRIVKLSAAFLNQPYQLEALGEGVDGQYNQKPLYRADAFDCETYVETVLALALANNLSTFQGMLKNIRYKNGVVAFEHRNHFTSADWIPNNQRLGIIKDLTAEIAGEDIKISHVYMDRQNWYRHLSLTRIVLLNANVMQRIKKWQQLRSLAKAQVNSMARIDYIPLDLLLSDPQVEKKIPNAALIFLVLENPRSKKIIGTENNISHMGFAIWKNGRLYLREASIHGEHVIDVPLLRYLSAYLPNKMLKGISVWEVINH